MVSCLVMRRNCSTKSEYRDLFIWVIVLKNVSDRFNCVKIFIFVHIQIVKWVRLWGVAIWQSKIDSDLESDFTATKDILKERMSLIKISSFKFNLTIVLGVTLFVHKSKFTCTFLQLSQIKWNIAFIDVLAWFGWFKELNANLTFNIIVSKLTCQ